MFMGAALMPITSRPCTGECVRLPTCGGRRMYDEGRGYCKKCNTGLHPTAQGLCPCCGNTMRMRPHIKDRSRRRRMA